MESWTGAQRARGAEVMQLERQWVRRKVYLAQVAVERGGAPLDGARVARRVAHNGLPLAQVKGPGGVRVRVRSRGRVRVRVRARARARVRVSSSSEGCSSVRVRLGLGLGLG